METVNIVDLRKKKSMLVSDKIMDAKKVDK